MNDTQQQPFQVDDDMLNRLAEKLAAHAPPPPPDAPIVHNNGSSAETLDLDKLFAASSLAPKPVKMGGHTYRVRVDLTGAEVIQYWNHVRVDEDTRACALLVGEQDAQRMSEAMNALPQAHRVVAFKHFMHVAGLMAEADVNREGGGVSGEASAS